MMEIGATDRIHAYYVNKVSGADRSCNKFGNGGGGDLQFGSSQSENIWKQWKTVEEVGVVTGLVVGNCRGDNSSDDYFERMNISRKGFAKEKLISNDQCQENQATIS